jgi:myo-inositol-1(or 4)-monophosphatase
MADPHDLPAPGSLVADLAAISVEVAASAARRALEWRAAGFAVTAKSTPTDLVTEVDQRLEGWIADEVSRRRPDDEIVGEEGTGARPGAGSAGVRWLIDPIDGTVNFALGLPQYGISLAAEVAGQVVAGCVVNPASGDVFRAALGGGAYRDPAGDRDRAVRLTGPREVALARAVVSTGFGYDAPRRARQGLVVARLLPSIGDVRRLGAASLDLCSVAAGWLDAHFEAGLHAWDYAAGLLIATEAGCVSTGLRGRGPGDHFCAVAGASLAPELFALLGELDADAVLRGPEDAP